VIATFELTANIDVLGNPRITLGKGKHRITDPRVINGAGIAHTWRNYLGPDGSGGAASEYAVPARAASLSGLPPAYILTCGMDPLRDQGLDFARALMAADVPVELKDVPGARHFFEGYAPSSQLAQRTTAHWLAALRGGLQPRGVSPAA